MEPPPQHAREKPRFSPQTGPRDSDIVYPCPVFSRNDKLCPFGKEDGALPVNRGENPWLSCNRYSRIPVEQNTFLTYAKA